MSKLHAIVHVRKHGKVDTNGAHHSSILKLNFLGQRVKKNSEVMFKLDFFHDNLCGCVKYSNVGYHVEFFKPCQQK